MHPFCSDATNSGTKNIAAVSKDSGDFILICYYYSAKNADAPSSMPPDGPTLQKIPAERGKAGGKEDKALHTVQQPRRSAADVPILR